VYPFFVNDSWSLGTALDVAAVFLCFALFLGAIIYGIYLAAKDARRRGKSPWLVSIACIFFFPWGLVAWLLFRPGPIRDGRGKFELENYRAQ
jgi:hypothetical protein